MRCVFGTLAVVNAMMFGVDKQLFEQYHHHGMEGALTIIDDGYQPTHETLLECAELRSPDLLMLLVKRVDPVAYSRTFVDMSLILVENNNLQSIRELLVQLDDRELYGRAWFSALVKGHYRINCMIFLAGKVDDNYALNDNLRTMMTRDPNAILELLCSSEHLTDQLVVEWLHICIMLKFPAKVFLLIYEKHVPFLNPTDRLELFMSLIENNGQVHLLPVILGDFHDHTRLQLRYVQEDEISRRLLQHHRLDLLMELLRTEWKDYDVEVNQNRLRTSLDAALKESKAMAEKRKNKCKIWRILRLFQTESIRILPFLSLLNLGNETMKVLFDFLFFSLVERGIIFEHIKQEQERAYITDSLHQK